MYLVQVGQDYAPGDHFASDAIVLRRGCIRTQTLSLKVS